ncbi:MAG TPA: hypothetical protein DDW29_08055, partial [Gammaproteobacteria bacterium]|nr:hypothetical protein [Gammaproteobacteria bacterium]
EGQMLMGHLLDFIIAARDPARALPIEMVSIHNRLGEDNTDPQRLEVYGVTTPRDLKRFFDDHKPGAGTPGANLFVPIARQQKQSLTARLLNVNLWHLVMAKIIMIQAANLQAPW